MALLAAYAWLGPQEGRAHLGLWSRSSPRACRPDCGKFSNSLASAVGAQRAGASRRSTLYAMIGSIGGAIIGAIVGLPVPVIGPILAAILFAGLGATAGAMWRRMVRRSPLARKLEHWARRVLGANLRHARQDHRRPDHRADRLRRGPRLIATLKSIDAQPPFSYRPLRSYPIGESDSSSIAESGEPWSAGKRGKKGIQVADV